MVSIKQDVKRDEMAALLNIVADAMPRAGHAQDLKAIAQRVKRGENDPAHLLIGCESDLGSLVAGCVSRILKHDW